MELRNHSEAFGMGQVCLLGASANYSKWKIKPFFPLRILWKCSERMRQSWIGVTYIWSGILEQLNTADQLQFNCSQKVATLNTHHCCLHLPKAMCLPLPVGDAAGTFSTWWAFPGEGWDKHFQNPWQNNVAISMISMWKKAFRGHSPGQGCVCDGHSLYFPTGHS